MLKPKLGNVAVFSIKNMALLMYYNCDMKGICLVPYIHMWNYIKNYNWNIYEHKNGRTLPRNKIKQYIAPLVFFSYVIRED
jgi:hypothetical protein